MASNASMFVPDRCLLHLRERGADIAAISAAISAVVCGASARRWFFGRFRRILLKLGSGLRFRIAEQDRDGTLSAAHYEAIVDRIHAGSGDPRDWVEALPDICAYVGGEVGQLVVADRQRKLASGEHFYALTPNRDVDDVHRFIREYGGRDPRRFVYLNALGRVFSDIEMEPEGFDGTGIVADYLSRLDIRRHLFCALAAPEGSFAAFTVMRSRRIGFFGDVEKSRMLRVARHMERSLQLATLLTERDAATAMLDLVSAPILIATASGRVVYANAAAERLAETGLIVFQHQRLTSRVPREREQLAAALRAATDERDVGGQAGIWQLREGEAVQRFIVLPLPERHAWRSLTGPGRLAAIVGSAPQVTPGDLLRVLYGLTSAETRIAKALTDGETLKEAALRFGISVNTARDHLKSAFRKMGIERQSQLVLAVREMHSLPLSTR